MPIRVMCAGDRTLPRRGLRRMIESDPELVLAAASPLPSRNLAAPVSKDSIRREVWA